MTEAKTALKAVFMIGDIYEDTEIPDIFRFAEQVFAGKEARCQSSRINIVVLPHNLSLEMIAVSDSKYPQKTREKIDEIAKLQLSPEEYNRIYSLAMDKVVSHDKGPVAHLRNYCPDILITGQTIFSECVVRAIAKDKENDFNPLIIRFSIFHGRQSECTSLPAKKAGYNIDFPKNLDLLAAFLSNPEFLMAVLNKNREQMSAAIFHFNNDNCGLRTYVIEL